MLFGQMCYVSFTPKMAAERSPFCQKCLKWGHVARECRGVVACGWCGSPHSKEQHRAACGECNGRRVPLEKRTPPGQQCPHAPRCVNCGESHTSDGSFIKIEVLRDDGTVEVRKVQCPFWKVKYKTGAWKKMYKQVRARQVLIREDHQANLLLRAIALHGMSEFCDRIFS